MASENTKSDETQPESFKEQLDRAAVESRENDQEQRPNPIVEKITEYIPAAAKFLGGSKEPPKESQKPDIPGPPNRPDHDPKIEEFVRDQHRSNDGDGILNLDKNS